MYLNLLAFKLNLHAASVLFATRSCLVLHWSSVSKSVLMLWLCCQAVLLLFIGSKVISLSVYRYMHGLQGRLLGLRWCDLGSPADWHLNHPCMAAPPRAASPSAPCLSQKRKSGKLLLEPYTLCQYIFCIEQPCGRTWSLSKTRSMWATHSGHICCSCFPPVLRHTILINSKDNICASYNVHAQVPCFQLCFVGGEPYVLGGQYPLCVTH